MPLKRKRAPRNRSSEAESSNKRHAYSTDVSSHEVKRSATSEASDIYKNPSTLCQKQTNGIQHNTDDEEQPSPNELPDFEMNASWGRYLSKQPPFDASPRIRDLAQQALDPHRFEPQHAKLYREYRKVFE